MYSITRQYSFSAAHRIEGHPRCGRLHGHNYEVIVEYTQSTIPLDGMLIDYGRLDELVKPIIDRMDHRYLRSDSNTAACDPYAEVAIRRGDDFYIGLPVSTAEFLAEFLWEETRHALMLARYTVYPPELRVTVRETQRSSATYSRER